LWRDGNKCWRRLQPGGCWREISGDFPKCFLDRQLEHVGTWLFAGSQRFAAEVVGIAVKARGVPLLTGLFEGAADVAGRDSGPVLD